MFGLGSSLLLKQVWLGLVMELELVLVLALV
jgi:hypothetical protein